jgi:sterol O-acyltransferase
MNSSPQALRQALRSTDNGLISTPPESASEEDYDDESQKPVAVLLRRRKNKENASSLARTGSNLKISATGSGVATPSEASSDAGGLEDVNVNTLKGAKVYTIASDDKELRDILRRGMQRVSTDAWWETLKHGLIDNLFAGQRLSGLFQTEREVQ